MEYVTGLPTQLLAVGVTEMMAVTGAEPVLDAVNTGVFPEPVAIRPMDVFVFVQLNVVPATVLLNADAAKFPPLQMDGLAGTVSVGIGLTVTLAMAVS